MTEVAQTDYAVQPAPVVAPSYKFDVHQRISFLIHALAKKGKSSLSSTAPKPALVLDAEGSWRFIPVRQVYWDPFTQQPPVYDGTWDVCIVHVREWSVVEHIYAWLTQRVDLPFVSVVVDSISEIQRRCKENLKGTDAMKIQDWGVLLARMDAIIRGIRDLTLIPQIAVRCVVFVSETKEVNGRWVPGMQGQIANILPYWVDVCGYLYPDYLEDGNGQPTQEVRKLWIGPHQQFEAGERVQGRLGYEQIIYRPPLGQVGRNIEDWMLTVFGITPLGGNHQ